jgi:hypothetical protein
MDIQREINSWKELKSCYEEEVDMGKNVEMNKWLAENAQDKIDELMSQINE